MPSLTSLDDLFVFFQPSFILFKTP
uniref:Uncharacterized protein n=1 Tax=Lepeophtheirus salmonis TaxID=72036 RepID=A0A0K2V536_LEPSM